MGDFKVYQLELAVLFSRIALLTTRFYKYVCIAGIAACVLILTSSIYPGQATYTLFWGKFWVLLLVLPPLGVLVIPAVVWLLWQFRHWLFSLRVCPQWLAIVAPVMAGITWGIVQFDIPQTLAFRMSQTAFEQVLGSVPNSVTQVDKRIGLYKVKRYGVDPRGGIYFHVTSGDVGLDMISHGFVYQPNRNGSPFGSIDYTLEHLTGDWYVFSETSTLHLF